TLSSPRSCAGRTTAYPRISACPALAPSLSLRDHSAELERERRTKEHIRSVPADALVGTGSRRDLPHARHAARPEQRLLLHRESSLRHREDEYLFEGAGVLRRARTARYRPGRVDLGSDVGARVAYRAGRAPRAQLHGKERRRHDLNRNGDRRRGVRGRLRRHRQRGCDRGGRDHCENSHVPPPPTQASRAQMLAALSRLLARIVSDRGDEEVSAIAEALQKPIEVLAAPPFSFHIRQRFPGAMRVTSDQTASDGDVSQTGLARGERQRKVEVAVEAVARIESAESRQGVAPGREAI